MALELKQSICILCGEYRISERTGTYNAETNPGGYGTPNPDFGDSTPYTIALTPPKATEPVYTLDLLDNPPTPDDDGFYNYPGITPVMLGYAADAQIPSGAWYATIINGTTETKKWILATGDIQARINECICCDSSKHVGLHLKMLAAERMFRCYKVDKAQCLIDELYRDTEECCGCGDC